MSLQLQTLPHLLVEIDGTSLPIEEKRRLKRERKQAAAAERLAAPDPEQTDTIVPLADGD